MNSCKLEGYDCLVYTCMYVCMNVCMYVNVCMDIWVYMFFFYFLTFGCLMVFQGKENLRRVVSASRTCTYDILWPIGVDL